MASIAEEMANTPIFRTVSVLDLRNSAHLWAERRVPPGAVLWKQGTAVEELALVASGMLVASVDGTEVGRILPAEIIGEVGAFIDGSVRSATLTTAQPTVLFTLRAEKLSELRRQYRSVYEALLEQALQALIKRIRTTNLQIAQSALGDKPAPARTEPSALLRLWKSLRPGGPRDTCPALEPLLCQQPTLRRAAPEVIEELARAFTPEAVEEGHILCMEGEAGASAWIVASGQIDVLRNVRGQKAELLTSLPVGSLFGINTLIERGHRTASCVASSAGWLWRIDIDAHQKLKGEARLCWRENLLAALSFQIRSANSALLRTVPVQRPVSRVQRNREEDEDHRFQNLLKASGFLESLPTDEHNLEKLTVVYDEDSDRNRKRKV